MKLTFSQSIILACVASSALATVVPAVPLEAREPRRVMSRKHTTSIIGAGADTAEISSNLFGRDVGDDFLVEREPARGRGRSRSARNAAQGVGSFIGAVGAQQLNQQNQESNVAARGLDIDESVLETREFEDDLLVERSPRGGFGRSRSSSRGQGRRRRRHRHNHNHTGPHRHAGEGASAVADTNASNSDGASNMEARDFEDDLLVERSPRGGFGRSRSSSRGQGRRRRRHRHNHNHAGPHRHAGEGASAVADTSASNSDGASNMETRNFEDDLLVERSPKKHRSKKADKKKPGHLKAAHLDDVDAVASEVTAGLQGRDFEDDLLFERDPRGGRGFGRGFGRHVGEAAHAAGSEAAANLETRDYEDDLLFQRSPRGGRGGGGRSGGGRSGGGRSGSRSSGRSRGNLSRGRLLRKPRLPHHVHDIVGEAGQQIASNIENRELGEDALVQREPFHPFRRGRKHSNKIASAAGAASSEVVPQPAPSSEESS